MRLFATLLMAICLTSCAAVANVSDYVPNCENKVYGVAQGLVATGTLAHAYTGLPLCGSKNAGAAQLCSNIEVIRTIKSAKATAMLAIKAAQSVCNESTFQAAFTAATAYQGIAKLFSETPTQ